MLRIGVTGGIGSGKTTVCSVWERMGARVVYADALAKSLMVKDENLRKQITDAFGEEIYRADGTLDRYKLSRMAFEQERAEELNQLVHPVVYRELDRIAEQAFADGVKLVAFEAALLLDKGRPDNIDAVVLVTAPESERIERVVQRDQTSEKQVRERMQQQKLESDMRADTDLIIENNGTKEALEKKAEIIYKELIQLHESK